MDVLGRNAYGSQPSTKGGSSGGGSNSGSTSGGYSGGKGNKSPQPRKETEYDQLSLSEKNYARSPNGSAENTAKIGGSGSRDNYDVSPVSLTRHKDKNNNNK
jgi:hypothetical protein